MESTPLNLADLRREYEAQGVHRADLDLDPFKQFAVWFSAAMAAGVADVNAMVLATTTSDCRPAARVVLLKGFDQRGFVFYTNYASEKGQHLEKSPYASLCLFWVELHRQIRISGIAEKTSREESEKYFHSRPLGAQLGAWTSRQSEVIDARKVLDARLAEYTERFSGKEVPLPAHWGGYRVKPDKIEFWQGRTNRLHDRLRYTLQEKGDWLLERLAP